MSDVQQIIFLSTRAENMYNIIVLIIITLI
jgi:hypothetical protein